MILSSGVSVYGSLRLMVILAIFGLAQDQRRTRLVSLGISIIDVNPLTECAARPLKVSLKKMEYVLYTLFDIQRSDSLPYSPLAGHQGLPFLL